MIDEGRTLADSIDARSFGNAFVMLRVTGGSTNAVIHLRPFRKGLECPSAWRISG